MCKKRHVLLPGATFADRCEFACNMWMKPSECVTIQVKASEQYFHVALFIMLYRMVSFVVFINAKTN